MHKDGKGRKIYHHSNQRIDLILHNVITLQSSDLDCKGKHMMKTTEEKLRIASTSLVNCATV
ncbi:hypothetical protein Bca101_010363 [Brassica carinata]